MQISKYHALGNDYIVCDPEHWPDRARLTDAAVIRICHPHFGVGSDGILWGPLPACDGAPFSLRIFNPDGSEAQKSGNGLRIFCRYLFDRGLVKEQQSFRVHTLGGVVEATILERGRSIRVEMGRVRFDSEAIPVAGAAREVIREQLQVGGETLTFTSATIGNPHAVVERAVETTEEDVRRLGPLIERNILFPERTNVQFLSIIDRNNIAIQIWERGAGYTLASGSSSSAAAAAAHRLGLVDRDVTVHMPGGKLSIRIDDGFAITMTGPVTRIVDGLIDQEMLEDSNAS